MKNPILVAGVGNVFMQDDGFGCEVVKRLNESELPPGVVAVDYGAGGLDLAYEVMRGYAALVLVDATRQGGEPGTVYLMEPDETEFEGAVEDGDALNPHAMDPATVLRFVKLVGGWPGKVVVVGCEPSELTGMAVGLSPPVEAAVDRAITVVHEQLAALRTDAAYS